VAFPLFRAVPILTKAVAHLGISGPAVELLEHFFLGFLAFSFQPLLFQG